MVMNFTTPLRGEFELTDLFVDLCNNMTLMNAFLYGLSFSSPFHKHGVRLLCFQQRRMTKNCTPLKSLLLCEKKYPNISKDIN